MNNKTFLNSKYTFKPGKLEKTKTVTTTMLGIQTNIQKTVTAQSKQVEA